MSPTLQNLKGLYLVLDRDVAGERPLAEIARSALVEGCRLFQYREKHRPKNEIYRVATELRSITAQGAATFIMNDFCDVALAVEADGVHLGQDDLPLTEARAILGKDRLIGISTHTIEQAREAEIGGANYIGFGPIYHTKTKNSARTPLGPNAAKKLREQIKIPIFGIGGINLTNIADLLPAGINGIAVLSAVLQAPEADVAVKRFIAAWPVQS